MSSLHLLQPHMRSICFSIAFTPVQSSPVQLLINSPMCYVRIFSFFCLILQHMLSIRQILIYCTIYCFFFFSAIESNCLFSEIELDTPSKPKRRIQISTRFSFFNNVLYTVWIWDRPVLFTLIRSRSLLQYCLSVCATEPQKIQGYNKMKKSILIYMSRSVI